MEKNAHTRVSWRKHSTVCVSVRVTTLTPSGQHKIYGFCDEFLPDEPHNRLISYYRRSRTLKLIFISAGKRNLPLTWPTFTVLTFIFL